VFRSSFVFSIKGRPKLTASRLRLTLRTRVYTRAVPRVRGLIAFRREREHREIQIGCWTSGLVTPPLEYSASVSRLAVGTQTLESDRLPRRCSICRFRFLAESFTFRKFVRVSPRSHTCRGLTPRARTFVSLISGNMFARGAGETSPRKSDKRNSMTHILTAQPLRRTMHRRRAGHSTSVDDSKSMWRAREPKRASCPPNDPAERQSYQGPEELASES